MRNNCLFLTLIIPKNTINCKCVINIGTYLNKNIFVFLKEDQTFLRLLFNLHFIDKKCNVIKKPIVV